MKSYQKIILLVVLAMSMCFSVILTASAAASDNLTFAVETSVPAAKPGDVVSVIVKATKNDGFFYGTVTLEYDPTLVEFVDLDTTDSVFTAVVGADRGSNVLVQIGTVANRNLALDPQTFHKAVPMTDTGVVFAANFKIKAVANDTRAAFTLSTTSRQIHGSAVADGATVANYNYIINGVRYADRTTVSTANGTLNLVAPNHNHANYGWAVVNETPEPCAHKVTTVYECKFCFEQKIEYGDSLLEKIAAKDYTCTEDGYTAHEVCKACGEKIGYELLKAAHRKEVIAAIPSTCTSQGMTAGEKCSACQQTLVAPTIAPLAAHTEVELPAVAATCTTTGMTAGKQCSVCKTITVPQVFVPTAAHTTVDIPGVAPTCTDPGLSAGKKCSVCNTEVIPQLQLQALGHNEEILEAVEPTWNKDGKTEGKKCSVCNTIFTAQETVPATGIAWWVILIIVVAVLAVAGGVVAILLLNKKKKA